MRTSLLRKSPCLSYMMIVACSGGSASQIARRACIAQEEQRRLEVLKAEQLGKNLERNPALRHEMQLEAQRKLEVQRDFAFQQMQDGELLRVFGLRSRSPTQEIAGHKQFWAWRKQAKSELEQLRETERVSRERSAQDIDASIHPRRSSPIQPTNTGESHVTTSLSYQDHITNILPITTPAAFALKQQSKQDQSGTEEKGSSCGRPPGRRISVCEIPQVQCKPEHYGWLQKGLRVRC